MNGIGARYEIEGCVGWLRATAALPPPVEVLVDDGSTYAEMRYRPIGVVGAITPWNWPLIIAIWQIAPSLRMGDTVVQKPSEYTTLSGLALVEVLNEVLPEGVLVPVTGAGDVGDALRRAAGPGGAVRPGAADHPLHRPRAGGRVGQRRRRRPRRLGLVRRPGQGQGDRGPISG